MGSGDRVKGHAERGWWPGDQKGKAPEVRHLYGQEEGSKRGGSDFVSGDRHDTAAPASADMRPSGDENASERASLQAGSS